MEQRVSHKKRKMAIDLSKPLDINIIGSEDDPCFGKLHSLTAEECRRCGDSEVCSIITAQNVNAKKRSKAHKEHKFKDLEEAELIEQQNKIIKKALTKLVPCKLIRVAKRVSKEIAMEIHSTKILVKSYISHNREDWKYDKDTKTINPNE